MALAQPYKAGQRVWHSVGDEAMAMMIGHGRQSEGNRVAREGVLIVGVMQTGSRVYSY